MRLPWGHCYIYDDGIAGRIFRLSYRGSMMWPGLRFGDGKSSLDGAGEAGSIHPHPDPLPPGERGVRPHPNPLPEGEGAESHSQVSHDNRKTLGLPGRYAVHNEGDQF